MTLPVLETPVKFHLSLNVVKLERSVEFYRMLFGLEPAKHHADYAKFELDDPPVVFSLIPHPAGTGGSLSHLGLRVADKETIESYRQRLEAAGHCTQTQDGTVCGYARQNKCWVKDPDGNFWEIYQIEEDVEPALVRQSLEGPAARQEPPPASADGPVVWEHFVTAPVPERVPHDDASVDEVRLVGTFNATLSRQQLDGLLLEVLRVLRPGGKVLVHGLMADRPFTGTPKLPGLAALVARVPVQTEPIEFLRAAGFVGAQVVKYAEQPWLTHEDAEMREVKLIAWKPTCEATAASRQVLYKGPFRQTVGEQGQVFPRGQRVAVSESVWQQLRRGAAAEQFLFLEPGAADSCSCQ